jgi:hypothetical protein
MCGLCTYIHKKSGFLLAGHFLQCISSSLVASLVEASTLAITDGVALECSCKILFSMELSLSLPLFSFSLAITNGGALEFSCKILSSVKLSLTLPSLRFYSSNTR